MAIQFKKRNKPKTIVDLIPMIDIVFQLVIFFMVATTFKTTTGIELELPNAQEVTTISTSPLKITVIDAENIIIGNKKTDLQNFKNVLNQEVIRDSSIKQSVIIYGNKKMEYQLLIDVMDILRIAGYESIDLALKKKTILIGD